MQSLDEVPGRNRNDRMEERESITVNERNVSFIVYSRVHIEAGLYTRVICT